MTRSKSIIAALALCALSVCAFGAASASATGLTAVECVEVAKETGNYKTNHCITPKVEKQNFETKVIPTGKTEVEGTDTRTKTAEEGGGHGLGETAKPTAIFHSTFNGIEVTVTCGKGNTTGGSVENVEEVENAKKEKEKTMAIHTTGAVTTWSECHASPKTKPTKICTVQGTAPEEPVGSIATKSLTATTTNTEHQVKIKPESGEVLSEFKVNASGGECFTTAAIEVKVTGEAWGRANTETHSHLTLDEASNSGSPLRANGNVASQTETVTGFKKGNKEATIGAETF